MDIDKFLIRFCETPAYQIYPEVRQLVGAFRLKLISVGMFCGDKAINDKETIQILTEFKQRFFALIKQLSGAESATPPAVNPIEQFQGLSAAEPVPKILTPEAQEKLLVTLKARFEEHNKNPKFREKRKNMEWAFIQARLEASPEKLWSLNEMERTGGEPDVIRYEMKTKEYIFMDCSRESPPGRRELCYDSQGQLDAKKDGKKPKGNAVDAAKKMGIKLLNKAEYILLQKLDVFDTHSISWIATPVSLTNSGHALTADRVMDKIITAAGSGNDHVYFQHNRPASNFSSDVGFRGILYI